MLYMHYMKQAECHCFVFVLFCGGGGHTVSRVSQTVFTAK